MTQSPLAEPATHIFADYGYVRFKSLKKETEPASVVALTC